MSLEYLKLFLIFLRLGLTSFGGPSAHISIFFDEFVTRRKWLSASAFTEAVTISQTLPGPASSQVGIIVGYQKLGLKGSVMAWLGFTLPSLLLMIAAALAVENIPLILESQMTHDLKLIAVPVIGVALYKMTAEMLKSLRKINHTLGEIHLKSPKLWISALVLSLFLLVLVNLFIFQEKLTNPLGKAFFEYLSVGSLIFGGGHVALPLMESFLTVDSSEVFLAGYGFSQALPGPLFSITAFTAQLSFQNVFTSLGLAGAAFLPSFIFALCGLSFWNILKQNRIFYFLTQILCGAAILFLAQTYWNSFLSEILFSPKDLGFVTGAAALIYYFKQPLWLIVLAALVFNLTYTLF